MSSRPRGDRRCPLGSEAPPCGDRRRPLAPEPPPSGYRRCSLVSEAPPRGDRRRPLALEPPPRGDRRRPQRGPQLHPRSDDVVDGADLISGLPDDLIHEVLVRLRCARAAARTSALSRRWRDMWRQLRKLYFRNVRPTHLLDVLAQVTSSELDLLHVSVREGYFCRDPSIAPLLRAASSFAPVEFFFSGVGIHSSVELPSFHRAKSISLNLQNVHCHLDSAGDFPMLERLSVSECHANFTDLISRCPRLRALQLGISNYPEKVRVHSSTIRELVVAGGWNGIDIDIEAPLLEKLSLSRCSILNKFEDDFCLRFPCMRSLRLRPPNLHRYELITLKLHSTTIEEIVLDCVGWMLCIHVDAPALTIFTLCDAHLEHSIHIVAPVLKVFTLSVMMDCNVKMLLSAPAVENLSWECTCFSRPPDGIHWVWFLKTLNLWMEEGVNILHLRISLEHPGSDPPNFQETLALPNISTLKLNLCTSGHAYGTTAAQILKICSEIRKLHLVIHGWKHDKACGPNCSCGQPESWRDQDISLAALEEVEIEEFGGKYCEVDLLKLLFKCAPLMKRVTVKPCPDMLPTYRACKEICNLFKAHPSVRCCVYDNCGKKVVYERSVFASRCR